MNTKNWNKISRGRLFASVAMTTFLLVGFNNCGRDGGTTTGNPMVEVRIESFDAAAKVTPASSSLQPMSVTTLKMCFKRLRFKQSAVGVDTGSVDLHLGEVTISPSGTDLTSVEIPDGTYERVEFDLDDTCLSGKSIQIQNANGFFTTTENTTIRFDGIFTVENGAAELDLNIQSIITALNSVSANSQIRNKAESASGSF